MLQGPYLLRRGFLLIALLSGLSVYGAQQRRASSQHGVSIKAGCGVLSVVPIADGALRVRCAPAPAADSTSLVLIHPASDVRFSIRRTAASVTLATTRLTATYLQRTGTLRFADAKGRILLEELPGSRRVIPSSVQGQPTLTSEDRFRSSEDEHIFGSGQFQDGFLDIRDLPRRLTQVNSQISIPFLLSSKGYGLLWHNYGLTNLNPADEHVTLAGEASGNATTAAVTTA